MSDIMSIHDFNTLPEGTELNYKSGGYGWWIGDEQCHSRGGRQVNGTLMNFLDQLGVGMGRRHSVRSHQTRFYVETKPVNVKALETARATFCGIWRESNIARQYELVDCLQDFSDFRLTEWDRPCCYWARGTGLEEKAFRFMGHRWVYGRACNLKRFPERLDRLLLAMRGRDVTAESRARMVEAA